MKNNLGITIMKIDYCFYKKLKILKISMMKINNCFYNKLKKK